MNFGNIPRRKLHLLPPIRVQKERPRQRDVQFFQEFFTRSHVPRVPHRVRMPGWDDATHDIGGE